ncbi:MAG: polyprenyl synthetase family protein [Flavobacteriales bacterium]|nr:polyprenyl synthetase family protein [Flavobacteriales bacterium]
MKNYKELLQIYLDYQRENPFEGMPDELYTPANYILELGGKRIRPILVLLAYQLFEKNVVKALPLAHAVEVFHNFTLMHDDIMDNADVRRGKPTVHKKWNQNVAILSGDVMLVKAYQLLEQLETSSEIKMLLMSEFGKMAEEVCVGQQMDMNFETAGIVSEEEYIEMIRLKTAVLLAFSLKAGAILAGASIGEGNLLYEFGIHTGLGFQVMDDYLDTFGNAETFGKKIGGDILENKKTLLWIAANRMAQNNQLAELREWYSSNEISEEKIKNVTALFKTLGVDKFAEDKMNHYFDKAENQIKQLTHLEGITPLMELTKMLQTRTQ